MDIREFSTLKSLMSVQIFGSRLFNVLQVVKELGRHLKRKSKESGNESGGTVFGGGFSVHQIPHMLSQTYLGRLC